MIIQLKGNVKFPLTLDPTVWIFDDRKIVLEDAFQLEELDEDDADFLKRKAEIFEEVYLSKSNKPPTQKTVAKYKKDEVLKHSYVIPIKDFILNAEANNDANRALLHRKEDTVAITYEQLVNGYALFSIKGKPLHEDGPIHFIFGDGSNKDTPIEHVKSIEIQ